MNTSSLCSRFFQPPQRSAHKCGNTALLFILSFILSFILCLSSNLSAADPKKARKEKSPDPFGDSMKRGISPSAKSLLDEMRTAYKGVHSIELTGTVSSDVEMANRRHYSTTHFNAQFQEPNQFRHASEGELVLGSTGEKAYVLNTETREYMQVDAPKRRGIEQLPGVIPGLLLNQNPSLLFTLLDEPVQSFTSFFNKVTKGRDTTIDGVNYPTIILVPPEESQGNLTLVLDPTSHLVRQLRVDLKWMLEQHGARDLKSAEVIIDYSQVRTGVTFHKDHFAWNPPQDGRDIGTPSPTDSPTESDTSPKPKTQERTVGIQFAHLRLNP